MQSNPATFIKALQSEICAVQPCPDLLTSARRLIVIAHSLGTMIVSILTMMSLAVYLLGNSRREVVAQIVWVLVGLSLLLAHCLSAQWDGEAMSFELAVLVTILGIVSIAGVDEMFGASVAYIGMTIDLAVCATRSLSNGQPMFEYFTVLSNLVAVAGFVIYAVLFAWSNLPCQPFRIRTQRFSEVLVTSMQTVALLIAFGFTGALVLYDGSDVGPLLQQGLGEDGRPFLLTWRLTSLRLAIWHYCPCCIWMGIARRSQRTHTKLLSRRFTGVACLSTTIIAIGSYLAIISALSQGNLPTVYPRPTLYSASIYALAALPPFLLLVCV
jgi:hypothetical protein